MKAAVFSIALAAAVETSFGFQTLSSRKFRAGAALNAETKSQAGDPIRFSSVDMEHAEDCAEHFGKCSTKELKQIKEDLHQQRLQNLVFGANAPEDTFSAKLMEEEISLQLNLLQNEMPPSTLFPPEGESPMAVLPHANESVELAEKVKHDEQAFLLEEMAEEGVLDSLAICALIGVLMFAPQFL